MVLRPADWLDDWVDAEAAPAVWSLARQAAWSLGQCCARLPLSIASIVPAEGRLQKASDLAGTSIA